MKYNIKGCVIRIILSVNFIPFLSKHFIITVRVVKTKIKRIKQIRNKNNHNIVDLRD